MAEMIRKPGQPSAVGTNRLIVENLIEGCCFSVDATSRKGAGVYPYSYVYILERKYHALLCFCVFCSRTLSLSLRSEVAAATARPLILWASEEKPSARWVGSKVCETFHKVNRMHWTCIPWHKQAYVPSFCIHFAGLKLTQSSMEGGSRNSGVPQSSAQMCLC